MPERDPRHHRPGNVHGRGAVTAARRGSQVPGTLRFFAAGGAALAMVASAAVAQPAGASAAATYSPDAVGAIVSPHLATPRARAAAATATVTRLAGPSRFATAALAAETAYPSADTVLLANGLTPADALAGGYLAGNMAAP